MRITLTYVILEIVRRYGAIPLFIVLVIASVLEVEGTGRELKNFSGHEWPAFLR